MVITNKVLKEHAPYIKFKNDCNFEFANNNKILISGPNGIGKSTLLSYIYENYKDRYKMFYFTQELIKFNNISIENLIDLIGEAYTYNASPYEAMQFLNLDKKKIKKFSRLSGGEKQKVMIAIALCCEVDVLLLDEPLNNLDEDSVIRFNKLAASIATPMLIVSHIDIEADYEVMLDV